MRQLGFPKAKLLTKFEVSGSCSFEVMFDCRPKIWGVTWYRPRPFWGKLLALTLGFSKMKLYTKFEVCSSNIFEDIWDRLPEILGVTCPRPRPFWFKLFERPLGFSHKKLCTKFEVSSWSCFEDMFDCIPKNWGVTWHRPRPFWGKLFERPLSFPQKKLFTKFEVVCWNCNYVRRLAAVIVVVDELCDNADEQLFDNVRRNSHHTLHSTDSLIIISCPRNLRSRAHNCQLPEHFNHLYDSNFNIRIPYAL